METRLESVTGKDWFDARNWSARARYLACSEKGGGNAKSFSSGGGASFCRVLFFIEAYDVVAALQLSLADGDCSIPNNPENAKGEAV
jgi:hypothetical protein